MASSSASKTSVFLPPMEREGPHVEFDRQVADDAPPPPGIDQSANRIWRSVRIVRISAMLLGAVLGAYLTHLAGLSLNAALCVFIGAAPLLWLLSAFIGLAFGARRARVLMQQSGQAARLEQPQHVLLQISAEALEVTLKQGAETESHRWPWKEVRLDRHGQHAFYLTRELHGIEVPRRAFTDEAAFEAVALAAQARIWAALK
jgi:hypothetical protein